jgi:DNA-binding transcriptional ArsR family regulator
MPEVLDKKTLKAISTETRQEIVKLLSERPHTASELSKKLNKHVTTVSEHLDILERSGLIRRRDSTNKWIYYVLTNKGEKLVKPRFYSWIIVLGLSIVCLVTGIWELVFYEQRALYALKETQTIGTPAIGQTYISLNVLLGLFLISISILGFVVLIKWKKEGVIFTRTQFQHT